MFAESLPSECRKILDLGCGSGRDSMYFIEEGFDVTAVDGSEALCELAKIEIGQEVQNIRFEELEFDNVFDGVCACASLLHVSKNDIEDVLNKLYDSLKKNGILYASFKYGESDEIITQKLIISSETLKDISWSPKYFTTSGSKTVTVSLNKDSNFLYSLLLRELQLQS